MLEQERDRVWGALSALNGHLLPGNLALWKKQTPQWLGPFYQISADNSYPWMIQTYNVCKKTCPIRNSWFSPYPNWPNSFFQVFPSSVRGFAILQIAQVKSLDINLSALSFLCPFASQSLAGPVGLSFKTFCVFHFCSHLPGCCLYHCPGLS